MATGTGEILPTRDTLTLTVYDGVTMSQNGSSLERYGNIAILNLSFRLSSTYATDSWVSVYTMPIGPRDMIYQQVYDATNNQTIYLRLSSGGYLSINSPTVSTSWIRTIIPFVIKP